MANLDRRSLQKLLEEARLRNHASSYLARRASDLFLYLLISLAVCALFFGPVLFAILIAAYVFGKWNEARIRIEAEGIRIREGGRKTYFHRYLEIVSAEASGSGVEIRFHHRKPLTYRFGLNVAEANPRFGSSMAHQLARELSELCEQARKDASALEISWLEPSGKNTSDWLASLRRIGATERSHGDPFRAARISREALWCVVESVAASRSQRLAASIALLPSMTNDETTRLRVAIELCRDRTLAHDLRAISENRNDDEIETLLRSRRVFTSP